MVWSYDRAGAEFSDRTARPRSPANMTEEPQLLAVAAGFDQPFLLIGHSFGTFGGLPALDYARRYPTDVLGLVLVDSMHPEQFERFASEGVEVSSDPHMVLGRTPSAASVYALPPDLYHLALQLAQADKTRVFIFREMQAIVDNAHALRDAGYPSRPARLRTTTANGTCPFQMAEWSNPGARSNANLPPDSARRHRSSLMTAVTRSRSTRCNRWSRRSTRWGGDGKERKLVQSTATCFHGFASGAEDWE
jgi:pimeloyl-ACP methyl ester carboxylesterase